MTYSVPRTSAIALSVAALVLLSALSAARAYSASQRAPTPGVTMPAHPPQRPTAAENHAACGSPSPNRPACADASRAEFGAAHRTIVRIRRSVSPAHHRYAYRSERRSDKPAAMVAMGGAGGPRRLLSRRVPSIVSRNDGSCSVRRPHRY